MQRKYRGAVPKEAPQNKKIRPAAIAVIAVLSVAVITFAVLIILGSMGVFYPEAEGVVINPPIVADDTLRTEGDYAYKLLNDGTAMLVGWTAGDSGATEAITPTEIGGVKVTAVANHVFAAYPKLSSVTFSEGITYIGKEALYGAMAEVYLPSTLKQIDKGAFAGFASEGIHYAGTAEQWKKVKIAPDNLAVKKVIFDS